MKTRGGWVRRKRKCGQRKGDVGKKGGDRGSKEVGEVKEDEERSERGQL